MGDFLTEQLQTGDPVAKVPASFYTKVDEVLTFLEVHNGYIEKTENFWRIVVDPDPGDGIIDGPKGLYHFKIRASDTDEIQVLGGSHRLIIGDDITRTPFSGDAGDAPTVDLFRTVTITENVYVYIELDDILNPNTLTVGTSNDAAGYPVAAGDGAKLVLGYVTFNAVTSKITAIEQYWTGGDWEQTWAETDDASTEYKGNVIQILDWDIAASTQIDNYNADLIVYKDDADGEANYTSMTDFSTALVAYWGTLPTLPFAWSELSDTSGDPTVVGDGYIPVTVSNLLTLVDGSAEGNGPWWVLDNSSTAGAYGSVIGNHDQDEVIDLDNEQLITAGGAFTVDWNNRQFDGADWSFLAGTILKVLDTTVAASGDGALEVTGGGYFGAGLYVNKGGASKAGYFSDGTRTLSLCDGSQAVFAYDGTRGAELANGTAAGAFGDGTDSVQMCNGSYGVDVTDGAGINIHSGGNYYHGAVSGASQTSPPLTIADTDGVDHTYYLRGGILCAS